MRSSHMIAQLAPAPRHEIALRALAQHSVLPVVVLQYTEVLCTLKIAPRTLEHLGPGGVSQYQSFRAVLGMCPSHVIVKSVPVDDTLSELQSPPPHHPHPHPLHLPLPTSP